MENYSVYQMSGSENTSFYVRNNSSLKRCIFLPGLVYFSISYQNIKKKTASNLSKGSLALMNPALLLSSLLPLLRKPSFGGLLH